jgi:secreted PhoX family phosphatase
LKKGSSSPIERRDFIRLAGGLAASAMVSSSLWSKALAAPVVSVPTGPYGALGAADANRIQLPSGFTSRVVARASSKVTGTNYTWHRAPDGGATFRTSDGGWIYVSNSEYSPGGVGVIRFSAAGVITGAYAICTGTRSNCAGGATPWGTWLTCEEYTSGRVWECNPLVANSQVARPALGTFKHEAAAVDPNTGYVYLTEDETNGRFSRVRPNTPNNLSAGTLEVARVSSGSVTWSVVPRPNPSNPTSDPTRLQVSTSTAFNGGEGIVYNQGILYFTTKGDNKIWEYDPLNGGISVLYDANSPSGGILTGVDNISASAGGDLFVAEDGGNMELVLITPDNTASAFLRVTGQSGSELTGPAFNPAGTKLYFSSQRGGTNGRGITYEISGPFRG